MAKYKYRTVTTRFWTDGFISDLNPLDRYLFLYFLTNDHTNISGIYEVPLRTVSFETGLEMDMLKKMFIRLDGKIYYIDGWVYIKNFAKYQASENPSVQKGIQLALSSVPSKITNKIKEIEQSETGPIQGGYSLVEDPSNLNRDLNLNLDREFTPSSKTSEELAKEKLQEEAFVLFWKSYPRKTDKIVSKRRFLNLNPKLYPKIMAALEVQKKTKQWQDKDFIPEASAWLNRGRYEDEITSNPVDPIEEYAKELVRLYPPDRDTTAEFKFSAKYGMSNLLKYKNYFNL